MTRISGATLLVLLMLILASGSSDAAGRTARPPNILLILLDDLDLQLNSSSRGYLPNTYKYIADQGITFNNMVGEHDAGGALGAHRSLFKHRLSLLVLPTQVVSMALCCPSRVSLLTGVCKV